MKHKHQFKLGLMVLFTVIIFVLNVYPFIKHNGAGSGYEGDDEGGVAGIQCSKYESIEYYIMAGSGYYLEANSHIQTLLKMVEHQEINGIDYTEMQAVVQSALIHMQKAKESYDLLIEKAEATPYNEPVLVKLRVFDYDSFAEENGFNLILFDLVRQYLQNGDITGIFKRTYSDMTVMIDMLSQIHDLVSQSRLPGINLFRKLNETQALSSVFGSYVARVFTEIQ